MSYSFSIPSVTAANPSDLERAVAESIAGLSDGPGKDEAATHEAIILAAIPPLAQTLGIDAYSVYVNGSRTGETSASLSLGVTAVSVASTPAVGDEADNGG